MVQGSLLGSLSAEAPRQEPVALHPTAFVRGRGDAINLGKRAKRGVSFLRRIVAENDRVEIDRPSKSITVTGTSGLSYSVVPTLKGEGARFSVWPLDENGAQLRLRAQRG